MKLKSQRTKKILFLTTLILPIILLGIPFTKWGFKTDDWGNVYHSIIHDWHGVINFFTEGNSEALCHPLNHPGSRGAFFQGLYRPMSFIYYFIQYCFFGTNPYGFYLVTMLLHALNAGLLFLIFCNFASLTASFLAALFFAFHPSLSNWIGWTSAETYFIELFVLLLILFALQAYFKTKNLTYYVAACALYCANMFLKEQTIFFPVWLIGACYFYPDAKKRCLIPLSADCSDLCDCARGEPVEPFVRTYPSTSSGRAQCKSSKLSETGISISSGFWLVSIFYTLTRLHFFPLTKATGTLTFQPTLHSFIIRMSSRFFDFVTYANDILGLSWLGNGNQLLKGSIMAAILAVLTWLFIKSKQKKFIIFSFLSMLLFSWPALLMHYQPRYIYLALPWSILIVLLIIPKIPKNKLVFILVATLITFNACFLMNQLAKRQEVLHMITTAFGKLVADERTTNRAICFLALPEHWFKQGSTQAVWMLRKDESIPVYQFDAPPDEYLTFSPIKNGFICASAHATTAIIIEEQYLQDNPLFVVWDWQNRQFRILDEKPL